jgi:hypothetical protein
MTPDNFLPVKSFSDPLQAGMIKVLLEDNNIICYLDVENHVLMNWIYLNCLGGITLFVESPKFDQSKEIVNLFELSTVDTITKCPQCRSENIFEKNSNWFWKLLWITISGTPSPYSQYFFCNDCKNEWNTLKDEN